MTHTHRYRFPSVTMLTLPDVQGDYDAVLLWYCLDCGQLGPFYTCQMHRETKGMTYEVMRAIWERECKEGVAAQ